MTACMPCSTIPSDGVALGLVTAGQGSFDVWGRLTPSGKARGRWHLVWSWFARPSRSVGHRPRRVTAPGYHGRSEAPVSPTLSSRKFTLYGLRAYHPDLHSLPHHCSLRCPMIAKRILPCRGFAPSGTQSLPDHGKRHQGRGQGRREQPPDGRIWAQLPEIGIDKGETHSDASLCQGAPSVLLEAYGVRLGRWLFVSDLWPVAFLVAKYGRRLAAPPGPAASPTADWQRSRNGRPCPVHWQGRAGLKPRRRRESIRRGVRGGGPRVMDRQVGRSVGAAYTVSGANAGPAARLA